ncbi:TVP38/TMEM64 family protein [Haloarchaeobius sp. HRN-SO-5]|uniref:TVP38/TMEM64 family protein n=1 Tax=Haloarchaeobius sp. HRN-SO-5 TaxID=3446118 RepID=UPI003EBE5F24
MNPDRFLAADADRRQLAAAVAILVALLVAGSLLTSRLFWFFENPEVVREAVAGFGVFAPVAFVLLQAAQVVVAPIPSHVLSFAAGYLFGPTLGFVYSMLGATAGTYVGLLLARWYGRPAVERFLTPEAVARFDRFLGEYGLAGVFVVFLLPGFPDDVVCLVAGLSDLDVRKLVVVAAIGRTPGYLVLVFSGAGVAQGRLYEAASLLAAAAVVGALLFWRRRRLLAWVHGRLRDDAVPRQSEL